MARRNINHRLIEVCRHCLKIAEESQKASNIESFYQSYEQDFMILMKDTYLRILDEGLDQELLDEFDKIYKGLERYPIIGMWKIDKTKIEKDFTAFSKDFLALCELITEFKEGN